MKGIHEGGNSSFLPFCGGTVGTLVGGPLATGSVTKKPFSSAWAVPAAVVLFLLSSGIWSLFG